MQKNRDTQYIHHKSNDKTYNDVKHKKKKKKKPIKPKHIAFKYLKIRFFYHLLIHK